jgi:hypothetical protein
MEKITTWLRRAQRVMAAMLKMTKIEVDELERAAAA